MITATTSVFISVVEDLLFLGLDKIRKFEKGFGSIGLDPRMNDLFYRRKLLSEFCSPPSNFIQLKVYAKQLLFVLSSMCRLFLLGR